MNFVTKISSSVFGLLCNSLSCSELTYEYAKNHLGIMFVGLHGLSGIDVGMGAEIVGRQKLRKGTRRVYAVDPGG